jgi:hypothetical protein
MTPFIGHSVRKTIQIATVVMTDAMLTGRERQAVSATMKWPRNGIAHCEGMTEPGLRFDQLGHGGSGR